jgi:hypothetical protein
LTAQALLTVQARHADVVTSHSGRASFHNALTWGREAVEDAVILAAADVEGGRVMAGLARQVRGHDHVVVEPEHGQCDVPAGEPRLDPVKNPGAGYLTFTTAEWEAFLTQIKHH